MSIRVTINQHNHLFERTLEINRITDDPDPQDDPHEAKHEYEVIVRSRRNLIGRTTFRHRYGDPVVALFGEATAAVRAAGIDEPGMSYQARMEHKKSAEIALGGADLLAEVQRRGDLIAWIEEWNAKGRHDSMWLDLDRKLSEYRRRGVGPVTMTAVIRERTMYESVCGRLGCNGYVTSAMPRPTSELALADLDSHTSIVHADDLDAQDKEVKS